MSVIGIDRQPMRAPMRAIGKIEQHLKGFSVLSTALSGKHPVFFSNYIAFVIYSSCHV
jgi:hypothetical protein